MQKYNKYQNILQDISELFHLPDIIDHTAVKQL